MGDPEARGSGAELPLGPDARRALQLDPEEHLGLLEAGERTVLLERRRAAAGPLPRDRKLALSADLSVFPLAEVLGMMHAAGLSGLLLFSHREHAKSVFLHRGEVIFACSNQRVDRLGECLVRAGVLTFEQLREAERRFTPPERFGKVLVERNFLSPRELWNGVKYQVEEIVRSLFSYPGGMVYFWQGEIQPENVVRLALPTRRLVSEGLQRREELMRFLALLEDPRVRLEPVPGRDGSLAGDERRLFELLSGESAFPRVCQRFGRDALSTARTIQLLRLVGAVRVQRTREDGGYLGEHDLREHDEDALRKRVKEYLELLEGLTAPLRAADGREHVRERLTHVIEDLAQRFPELLLGIEPDADASLDVEELTARALRLPEEAEARLQEALGELISYLEFELKNHPHIDDADRRLEDLRPLRARLLG